MTKETAGQPEIDAVAVTIGRGVHYVSRTGNYEAPAVVTAVQESLFRPNVDAGYIPDLTDPEHVHLTVFTAGKPGKRAEATDFLVESPHGRSENAGGVYQEWEIPHDPKGGPGTWHWHWECALHGASGV